MAAEGAAATRGPFRKRAEETLRLLRVALAVTWQVSPALALATVGVLVVQATLPPLQLSLSRLVLDRAALDLGHAVSGGPLAARLPLLTWILLAAAALALGQLLQHLANTFRSAAGDGLSGAMTDRLLTIVSGWRASIASRTQLSPTTWSATSGAARRADWNCSPTAAAPSWPSSPPSA